jgi:hypothetical protein
MSRELRDISFEAWLQFVFDHPVTDPAWHWSSDADSWAGSAFETLQHFKQTFQESGTALVKYSDEQLNQGFWYLVSNSCSNIAYSLVDISVAWADGKDCIESIVNLFRCCFQARCTSHLSHLNESGANALNSICYMWWDVLPIHGQPESPERRETDETILQVMEKILALPSDACRESALHGLGEWRTYYPSRGEIIVDAFIWQNRKIRDSLRNYAYAARHGDIL